MLPSLLKHHYSYILLTLKAITINLHLSFEIDKELRIPNHINYYFLIDTLLQEFTYSQFVPCLLLSLCIYNIKTTLKEIIKTYCRLT